jgi:hypothetical protein
MLERNPSLPLNLILIECESNGVRTPIGAGVNVVTS